ncbi:hypothetical protein [Roseovarius aquimarinus]|uniref:Uncharacterized protein n=1 Tax=Roseovarius aquimarinus TaxID=1229156 RepID=A0ABW7I929_9RHOB
MAEDRAKSSKPRHTEAGPEIAPHGREKMMEEHRGRREDEPAAAAMETDAESGGASAISHLPKGEAPRDPAKQYEGATAPDQSGAAVTGGWLGWTIAALLLLAVAYAAMQF